MREQRSNTEWDRFVASHPLAHILQTDAWGKLKSQFGWQNERVTVTDETGTIQAGASMLFQSKFGLKLAYLPRGPLTDWQNQPLTRQLLEKITSISRQQGAAVLKFEPNLLDTPENRALLYHYGLRPSPQIVQPPSTIALDISGDENAILKQMKSKWRYNIRLSKRKDVVVREGQRADLNAFNELMQITGERDGFYAHSADYYNAAFDLFTPYQAAFLMAEYQGKPLAALAVFAIGKRAWYLWGASNNQARNRMPNHALQWAAIQWAKERGVTEYDFWGIPDEIGQVGVGLNKGDGSGVPALSLPIQLEALPQGELWGVYRFKQGFGGDVVRYVGAWDLPVQPWGYRLYQTGLAAQSWRRKLTSRRRETQPKEANAQPSEAKPKPPTVVEAKRAWQKALSTLPNPSILQSWEWGEVKGQSGWVAERLVIGNAQGTPEAAFQFLWRQPLPLLPLRVGYIPKGPLVDWSDSALVEALLEQIEAYAQKRRCIFVKIDPDVVEDSEDGRALLSLLQQRGWRYSSDQIQFKNTALSDLTLSEEALLAQMKSKWRYNIRLAHRREITIRTGSPDDFPAFYTLYAETGERDGFLIRPYDYYEAAWGAYLAAQADPKNPAGGALLLAEHSEESAPVAGLFLMRYGTRTWYFYGASSERRRRDMPNYLLQWEALRWAKAEGSVNYDWWGAPTDIEDPEDSMQGVWRFKQGFGAEFQPHIGAWDWPVSTHLYNAYLEMMPKALAGLRRLSGR